MERNTLSLQQAQILCNRELSDYMRAKNNFYIPAMRSIAKIISKMSDIQEVISCLNELKKEKGAYSILSDQLLDVIMLRYLYNHLPENSTIYYLCLASGHGAYYVLYVLSTSERYGMEMINITPDIAKACDYEQRKVSVKFTLDGHGLYQEHYPLYCGNIISNDIANGLSKLSQLLYNKDKAFNYSVLSTNVR